MFKIIGEIGKLNKQLSIVSPYKSKLLDRLQVIKNILLILLFISFSTKLYSQDFNYFQIVPFGVLDHNNKIGFFFNLGEYHSNFYYVKVLLRY